MAFTYQYSQPEEYHYSLDSIEASRIVAEKFQLQKNLAGFRILDLCAGCGVMGFELSWHLRDLRNIDFVEVQDVYLRHFRENERIVNRPELQLRFYRQNYANFRNDETRGSYDLVICNPPYFHVHNGKLSPSEFKNRCRFFIDSTFEELVKTILWVLKPQAKAYVLLREMPEHRHSILQELQSLIAGKAEARVAADVRGTNLVEIFLTQDQKVSES